MTYYASGDILAHVCPFCREYQLEAPANWDSDEVQAILGEHITGCTGDAFNFHFTKQDDLQAAAKKAGFMK